METLIELNKDVEDYFIRVNELKDFREEFEKGKFIIYDNLELDCDLKFLREIKFPLKTKRIIEKARGRLLLQPLNRKNFKDHILYKFFPNNFEKANYFREQIGNVTAQIFKIFYTCFPKYKLISHDYTWRFSLTEKQGLH